MAVQPSVTVAMRVLTSSAGQELSITGRIDVRSVADIRGMLHEVIDHGTGDVHVNLGEAEIGDATGLGVLVEAHHRARRAGRRMILGELTPRTERLLRASRLNRVLLRRLTVQPAAAPESVSPLTA